MEDVARELYAAAVHVARREDAEVHGLNEDGVFFLPELAYAYLVGKEFAERWAYGRGKRIGWGREKKLGGGGCTDLVIGIPDGPTVAVEFKVRDTSTSYLNDLYKLTSIRDGENPVDLGLFIALVDQAAGKVDPRIAAVESTLEGAGLSRVVPTFTTFATDTDRYAGDIECVVAAWTVGPR